MGNPTISRPLRRSSSRLIVLSAALLVPALAWAEAPSTTGHDAQALLAWDNEATPDAEQRQIEVARIDRAIQQRDADMQTYEAASEQQLATARSPAQAEQIRGNLEAQRRTHELWTQSLEQRRTAAVTVEPEPLQVAQPQRRLADWLGPSSRSFPESRESAAESIRGR